jgi:hypothetical protein
LYIYSQNLLLYIKRELEWLLNVLLPFVAGSGIYFTQTINGVIRNHLPDGLWAYALTYCLLAIWNKRLPFLWILGLQLLFILFEFGQFRGWVGGTGDLRDVIIYFLFSGAAFLAGTCFFINKKNVLYEKND